VRLTQDRTIFVDVDGTLHKKGRPIQSVIDYCRRKKAEGYTLVLWSARGQAHALEAVKVFGLHDLFSHVLSKPGAIIDDRGWTWAKYTKVLIVR
jgi:FMN phosphatase YigB (HAD superfamily)